MKSFQITLDNTKIKVIKIKTSHMGSKADFYRMTDT